jgi:hypothetical protein
MNRLEDLSELKLEPIKFKMTVDLGWSSDFLNKIELEYRKFWKLVQSGQSNLVPTKYVDEFWHYHILDTRKYHSDCEQFLGKFLHHFPYLGLRGEEDYINFIKKGQNSRNLGLLAGCDDDVCESNYCEGDDDSDARMRPGKNELFEYEKNKFLPGWEDTDIDRRISGFHEPSIKIDSTTH